MTPIETAAIGALFRAIAPKTAEVIAKTTREKIDKNRAKYESSFKHHVQSTLEKCRDVKTIFTGDESVPLKSIYTNLYIGRNKNKIRDDDIINNIDGMGNIVLTGTGGAGKTMLMKYLALNSIEYPTGRIPLFIELRNLPDHTSAQFYRTIFDFVTPEHESENYNIFREGLRNGIFLIFFDGLDEISSPMRERVFNSIKRMCRDFPNIKIISSTRPEIDTRDWGELTTHTVLGLTLSQVKNLINKVEFPEKLKLEFKNLLTESFYNKHKSFLSVPLLCSLMLLTYNEYQTVPSRLTVFYEQAFETLMRRHDRAKEGHFKRHFDSGLSSDRFRVIFSAFCYRTLALEEISFTDDSLRHHISRAAQVVEIEVNVDSYTSDLVSAVCVIMRDGLNLHFIHRSFQEYFSALYLLRYKGPNVSDLYDRLFQGLNVSDVAIMAADIDIQAFEREWALPAVEKIIAHIEKYDHPDRSYELLKSTWYSLRFSGNPLDTVSGYSWMRSQIFRNSLEQLHKVYGTDYPNLYPHFSGKVKDGKSFLNLRSANIDLPNSLLSLLKESGNSEIDADIDYEDEEEYGECTISDAPLDWIKNTTLHDQLNSNLDEIYRFRRDLKMRVEDREKIDLLK